MSKDTNTVEKRDGFQSKWGFILACIGSAVGMGNIWRFPIMVQQYGGMTFLLPYFLFVILIGASGVIEEFALGRRAKAGPVPIWRDTPANLVKSQRGILQIK